jgi:hypothetical protein
MKRWAILVVILYFLTLVALTAPLLMVAFYPQLSRSDALSAFANGLYWLPLAVIVAAQAVMLLVPVDLSLQRPVKQHSVFWVVLASGLMMGLLGAGVGASVLELVERGKALDMALAGHGAPLFAAIILVWAAWCALFYRSGREAAPADVVTRQCRYLLQGSILELLVAVPTHIVVRARDYCCAGVLTFLGIAFGLSVMLFSFGPGVFFLFAARWKQLIPKVPPA